MHKKKYSALKIPDTGQSAWQLASIQLSGWTSLPILATSLALLRQNSFWGAVLTIIVGNAILWFIRLGIVSMGFERRQSTMDLARDYLGLFGWYCIAFVLQLSTFFWFIAQITTGGHSITHLLPLKENPNIDQFTQVSVLLGTISSIFCIGGIVVLRRLSTLAFPVLCVLFLIVLYALPDKTVYAQEVPLSLTGLSLVLATNLGVTADLPTFFRHSKSWITSIKALTLVQLISIGFGLASLYLGSIIVHRLEINEETVRHANHALLKIPLIGFIFLSVVCANVANVYSSSVGWELVAPKALVGRKEYFILGLGITTICILSLDLFSLEFPLKISDSVLVNLSIVLVLGSLLAKQWQQLPDFFERTSYFIAWLAASTINVLQYSQLIFDSVSSVLIGFIVIVLIIIPAINRRQFTVV